jgi:hypothetical protein
MRCTRRRLGHPSAIKSRRDPPSSLIARHRGAGFGVVGSHCLLAGFIRLRRRRGRCVVCLTRKLSIRCFATRFGRPSRTHRYGPSRAFSLYRELSRAGAERFPVVRRWLVNRRAAWRDDQPGAAKLFDVLAENLPGSVGAVVVERMTGIGHLQHSVAPVGRAQRARDQPWPCRRGSSG